MMIELSEKTSIIFQAIVPLFLRPYESFFLKYDNTPEDLI